MHNKCTAFLTGVTFLRLNGWHFVPDAAEGVEYMERLGFGDVTEVALKTRLPQSSTEIV